MYLEASIPLVSVFW